MLRLIDGHNDVLLRLVGDPAPERAFLDGRPDGHLDYPRAVAGGFAGGFFAVFVPSPSGGTEPVDLGYAREAAAAVTATLERVAAGSGGRVVAAREPSDLEGDALAAILHFEGAEPLDPALEDLERWYERGLRSLGPVWSRPNAFAHGVPGTGVGGPDTGPGLTESGRALVRECNRLGIMLDLSHLNERGFWNVAELSEAPLVATHSNPHRLCPVMRNLTDAQLDAIAGSGGLVGISFHTGLLRPEPGATIEDVVRHVDYTVERIGVEHVAFGSDFDGATVPEELGDAAGIPRVFEALAGAGYDDEGLEAIARGNWLRVLGATWRP